MPTITIVNDFFEDILNGVHDLSSDSIRIALSNTAPASESSNPTASGNGVLANVTQISYTNYADNLTTDRVLQSVTVTETGGTATLDCADFTISASGGALASFRYIYIYNDTPTSPADAILAVVDEESTITLADGSDYAVTINASGILSIASA